MKKEAIHPPENLRQLIEAWQAGFYRDDAAAMAAAEPPLEQAWHAHGVYGIAAAGVDRETAEGETDPDRRAVLFKARDLAREWKPDMLRKLQSCPTFEGRERLKAEARHAAEIAEARRQVAAALAEVREQEETEAAIEAGRAHRRAYEDAVIKNASAPPSRSHAERAKARRTVKDKGDRRKVKAYCAELMERQGYTATGAYKEIARQAAKGQLGSKALSEHYIGITDKVVRGVIDAPD